MVGVLHRVHSSKYTVDTCTGIPKKNYRYKSDFSRLQPSRKAAEPFTPKKMHLVTRLYIIQDKFHLEW